MYHVALGSTVVNGDNKGNINLVEITSGKIVGADGKKIKYGTDFEFKDGTVHTGIPADSFKYPQFGPEPTKVDEKDKDGNVTGWHYAELTEDQANQAVQEMIKDAGNVIRLVENYNDATRTAALNLGKNKIRTKEGEGIDPAKVIEEGIRLVANFSWSQAARITNKSVRDDVEKVIEEMDSLSNDELKARLRAMMGAGK